MMRLLHIFLISMLFLGACTSNKELENFDWCDHEMRSEFVDLPEIDVSSSWFKVYAVGKGVYAIAEPSNYQEVISYLIMGSKSAILFDTGMGMDSISKTAKELTDLPITVINSHSHYDHIGGNHEFDRISSLSDQHTLNAAKNGASHEKVRSEITKKALCYEMLPETTDTSTYSIKPYEISTLIEDGHTFDLGERSIEVLRVPGHAPDAVVLLDEDSGYLWTGDTFYKGPIYLFAAGTNIEAYEGSVNLLTELSSGLNKVFPAHNTPVADPSLLIELQDALSQVLKGQKESKEKESAPVVDHSRLEFVFDNFSFIIRKELLNRD